MLRRPRLAVLALAGVLAAGAVSAGAATPERNGEFEVHDHSTPGDNWHVQMEVNRSSNAIKNVVVYAQKCGETGFAEVVGVREDGGFTVTEDTWELHGRFTTSHRVEGTWRVHKGTCDTGLREFVATSSGARKGHKHSGGSHKGHIGHAMGTMPDLSDATPRQLRRTKRLWRATVAASKRPPYNTYRNARRAGFKRFPNKWPKPLIFHLRHRGYEDDGRVLDPQRPESLVYWWPKKGSPILVGFMYRAPVGKPPGGPLFAWHRHFQNGRWGDNQMTHIWLTGGLRSALANCLPAPQIEAQIRRFRFSTPAMIGSMESTPCPRRR